MRMCCYFYGVRKRLQMSRHHCGEICICMKSAQVQNWVCVIRDACMRLSVFQLCVPQIGLVCYTAGCQVQTEARHFVKEAVAPQWDPVFRVI